MQPAETDDSAASAQAGGERKRRNLDWARRALNFGGQQQELWCEGGEVAFITQMIEESKPFARQVKWFTSLRPSRRQPAAGYGIALLTDVGAVKVVKKEMALWNKQKPLYRPDLYG